MPELYPSIEPFASGHLAAQEGHRIYYEECGDRTGVPVVFLHGGPGSSCNPSHRRFFDPSAYRIVLFDQRGCGRSQPGGELAANRTQDLVSDMERLRQHLGLDRWLLFGGSWGSTLALSYALTHPGRVLGMILRGVFTASRAELQWYLEGLRQFVPEAWSAFVEGIEAPSRDAILEHYGRWVGAQGEPAVRAAQRWIAYESHIMAIGERGGAGGSPYDGAAALARVRLQLHYLRNDCFLPQPLLQVASALDVPTTIVQGRRDLVCPPCTAYALHQALARSELRMVEDGGHSAMHPAMINALVDATDRMRRQRSLMV